MDLGRLLYLFGIAAAVVLPLRLWVFEPIYIATASMEPTLKVGVHVFMDKMTFRFREPKRGDIIVFAPPEGEEAHELVKRVIAVPGDTVELKEKKVVINGATVDEPWAHHKRSEEQLTGDNRGPYTLPADAFFVLGDNRDESRDSSVWEDPFLPRKKVRGIVRGFY